MKPHDRYQQADSQRRMLSKNESFRRTAERTPQGSGQASRGPRPQVSTSLLGVYPIFGSPFLALAFRGAHAWGDAVAGWAGSETPAWLTLPSDEVSYVLLC